MQTKIPVINEENIQEYLLYWSAQSLILLLSKSWNISCRAVYETRTYGSMGGTRILFSRYPIVPLTEDGWLCAKEIVGNKKK